MTILQHKPPQTASKIKETLCIFGILAGTAFTAISQQAALTSIPLLGLLMMQRTNQHRLTLAQQQQRQRIITEIQHLETQIHTTESSSEHYLTKTHLTPIIAKLHQLQRENKVFKLKELKDVTQHINTLEHQLDHLTHQTQNLQTCQHNLEQQFQHHSSQIQPDRHLKPIPTQPDNNRVAIFIDAANIYHSAIQLGLEPPDYADLLAFIKGQYSSYQAFFYTGLDSTNLQQKRLLFRLQNLGYKIISKEIIKRADGSCKANLDVELALDLVELADTYDTAILVSGDGDFVPALERIQQLSRRVEVVSYRATTSQKLMRLADNYLDLETQTCLSRVA